MEHSLPEDFQVDLPAQLSSEGYVEKRYNMQDRQSSNEYVSALYSAQGRPHRVVPNDDGTTSLWVKWAR